MIQALETCVKGVYASIIQHMKESSMTSMPTDTNKIELMVTTQYVFLHSFKLYPVYYCWNCKKLCISVITITVYGDFFM